MSALPAGITPQDAGISHAQQPRRAWDGGARPGFLRALGMPGGRGASLPPHGFERVVRVAARSFGAAAAWLALPAGQDEWIAVSVGPSLPPRIGWQDALAPCVIFDGSAAAPPPSVLVVQDALRDSRFARHPLVDGPPGLRFLAAAPVGGRDGLPPLGALCVADPTPRGFDASDEAALLDLAALAGAEAARLATLGQFDPRSLLPNRRQFACDLAAAAAAGAGAAARCRLAVVVELERGVQAAEFLGAPGRSADEMLRKAARVIEGVLPPGTILYHLEGARFAFLLAEHGHRVTLSRLVSALGVPVACGTVPVLLAPRIGAAPFTPDAVALPAPQPTLAAALADDLLRAAHAAAQGAPGTGGHEGWSLYDADADRAQRRALRLLSDLHPALGARDPGRTGQIALHYQPRMDLRTGRCAGVEALLRWNHPTEGGVPPGELMPLVERTALPRALTAWVLERALADAARWRRDGLRLGVSVNVSAPNLSEPDFAYQVGQLLDRYRLPPETLELELTEDALLRGARLRRTLSDITRLGVTLAIDDFGTGYSNLAYLRKLPAHVLKLDRSFVHALPQSARDRTIVQALIGMAHELDYRVVAEGVEDGGTLDLLRDWSCDEAQGFLFSPAMPSDDLPGWIAANGSAGSSVMEHEGRAVA